jgi:hypothetical protein
MASTINATTSGIVNIGDSVATLALQTGGTTAVAIDTAQIVTLSKSLALLGSTSGSVTIAAPAVAGSTTLTLPATSGTLLQSGTAVTVAQGGTGQTSYTDGQLLIGNSTGNTLTKATLTAGTNVTITNSAGGITIAAAGGGGSPGGSTTQVQYNNAGAFGGISGFTTDGTRVTASTTIGVGGATPATTGSGITFPSTPSNSSNVNTLDDYERGTWTPNLGGTATYSPQTGYYVKIGRLVYISGVMGVTLIGTGSTTTISGLPFSMFNLTDNNSPLSMRTWSGLATSVLYIVPVAVNGNTTVQFNNTSTAGTSNGAAGVAIFGNSARVDFGGVYYTND